MNIKNEKKTNDLFNLIYKKIAFFKDVIQKTVLHVQKNKQFEILGISDVTICIDKLQDLITKINSIEHVINDKTIIDYEDFINELQNINNELSILFKNYGTMNLEDLLMICFGNTQIFNNENEEYKFDLLKKYFHPISYKIMSIKNKNNKGKNKSLEKVDDHELQYDENMKNLDCIDINSNYKQFFMKIYGIKLYLYNKAFKKGMFVYGFIDDIMLDFLNNKYIDNKKKQINENLPNEEPFKTSTFEIFISSLSIKDYLINNTISEFYNKFIGYLSQCNNLKQKTISQNIKEFIADDSYSKRNTMIYLLINSNNYENQYLVYLLYDLLSNDTNGNIDTEEQMLLLDSLPWNIKKLFKYAMKKTIQYTNELSNFDMNKIPLEQQICLLKANENVKEKAMMKLKEIKSKSEDSGAKARQYLDGLLKIPFSTYKREPILHLMEWIKTHFKFIYKKFTFDINYPFIPSKNEYTGLEILKYVNHLINKLNEFIYNKNNIEALEKILLFGDKYNLHKSVIVINDILKTRELKEHIFIDFDSKTKNEVKNEIKNFINICKNEDKIVLLRDIFKKFMFGTNSIKKNDIINFELINELSIIENKFDEINNYMNNVKTILDNCVYGHDKAKKQIERILSQWISGEQKGNCFGFEGSPGVGKTTLAKGLSQCLKDENGDSRPFSLIMMGGDANSSHLVGHSYTYVGSTWGQIVQILIDKKCMNPIILIDEVDKISRTEHGKEITGVLTHLLDPTQNDSFQDKYFSGIELDLSKVLFILSYNDADLIDKILLDRIHRIKFDSLTLEDKIVICKKHLLPDIYKNIGLEDMIEISDDTLKFIIEEYTLEPGVRKLKEKLFEIMGEINLDILKKNMIVNEIPIKIMIDDIKNKYFKDKREIKVQKIHTENVNFIINGMYANSLNQGGILPFQACFVPAQYFLEIILTGNQKDVMREGMILSKNLAWNLTTYKKQRELIKKYNDVKNNCVYGININAVGLSIPKDGPSASSTICVLIYALLNDYKIKHYLAMTGEVSLDGKITEIGGLEYKILGSIKNGVREIIYPSENNRDFEKFYCKYKDKEILKNITFHSVNTIQEVFDLILIKE
jgi:ATP-dependent Lon protease